MDLKKIADHFRINIRAFEGFERMGKVAWQLAVGQGEIEKDRTTMDLGLYQTKDKSHCYYIKNLEALIQLWECQTCQQRFTEKRSLDRHLKNGCNGAKTKGR